MNNTIQNSLEEIIANQQKAKEDIVSTLTSNLKVDEDFAEIIALDTIQSAIGIKGIKTRHYVYRFLSHNATTIKIYFQLILGLSFGGMTVYFLGRWFLSLIVFAFIGISSFCSTHCSSYPRTQVLPESYRFKDEVIVSGDTRINDRNKLCLPNNGNTRGEGKECLHRKKVDEVLNRMDQALRDDANGAIWFGANGYGEVWLIERNNYRFVINRTEDLDYKE